MLTRRFFIAALVCVLAATTAPRTAGAASQQEAETLIQGLTKEAMAMASKEITGKMKEDRFRALLHSSFDLQEIGRFVLGRYWRAASQQQQQEFMRLFEDLTVLTWVRRFDDYGGETMDVVATSKDTDDTLLIETRVNRAKGPTVPVNWRVRDKNSGLKVIDIVVEGVSMAITHRSEYTSAIQSTGGLDGLLGAMRKKIATMSMDRNP